MRRIHKHRARCHLVNGFEDPSVSTRLIEEWEDLILVETPSGARAAIHLIDHSISLDELLTTFDSNQQQDLHTLYVLSAVMFLPDHGDQHVLEDWMAWLAETYGGKIYGYMVQDQLVDICPIYFTADTGKPMQGFVEGMRVSVRYGPMIDARQFRCWTSGVENGWLVADFAAGLAPEREPSRGDAQFENQPEPEIFADDPYVVLGVARDANPKTIRAAYLRLAREYHPDINPATEANRYMQAINAAYEAVLRRSA